MRTARAAPPTSPPRLAPGSQWARGMLAPGRRPGCYSSGHTRGSGGELDPEGAAAPWKSWTPEPPKKQSNWRRKHEELIAAIRAAKGVDQVLKEGGKLPPPPPPTYDPDYIQCPYCQRRFNESAADRHINFCKEQAARITNKGKVVTDSKGKLPTRTQSYLGSQTESVPEVRSTSKTFGNQSAAPAASQKPRKPLWMFRFQRTFTNRNTHFRICGFREPECPSTKAFGIQVQVAISKEDASIRNNTTSLITPTTTKGSMKSRTVAPTNMARNAGIGMMANKRKSYSTENYSNRTGYDSGDCSSSVNGASSKSNEGNSPAQLPKFCYECGAKYPVESAKFCCECGVRRMVL
uniref:Zinc finger C2HC domain-containing protein 1A n=1 Tax=Podarcis muralis TaxID=64176 RepID=A0A670IG13_PODMU